jgi:hypothetical protein
MTATTCFPDWTYPEGFKLPEGWLDDSWHNDAMPKFVSKCGHYFLWVDYADPANREYGFDYGRFLLIRSEEAFDPSCGAEEYLAASDDWTAISAVLNQI